MTIADAPPPPLHIDAHPIDASLFLRAVYKVPRIRASGPN